MPITSSCLPLLAAENVPGHIGPQVLAADAAVCSALNGWAVLGGDVAALLPHAGRALGDADGGGKCGHAAHLLDGSFKGGHGVFRDYHGRDCLANTNVKQATRTITPVNTLAERLKWARTRLEISQPELAARAGVSQGTIGNIESGTRKRPRDLLAIASALGVSPEWLESGRGEATPKKGVAQSLSHARPIIPLKRLEWGELMSGELPETFELEVQDDAMAPFLPRGCFARFSTVKPARAAWPVLVADADGHAYIRDYVQGRGSHFVAQARAPGYQPLDSEQDKLRVLAVLTGVDWG